MLEQFWGLEGMFSGYWKKNPSLKLAFHPSQVMNTCPVCVVLCDERGPQLVLPRTKGRYMNCKGCIGPPHLCAKY